MKALKILIVEDEYDQVERVEEIARSFEASESIPVDVQVMTMVPLRGRLVSERTVEEAWDYDAIVLDLKVPISGDDRWKGNRSKYGVYGGCLAADLIASSGFKGFVLTRSAFTNTWPQDLEQGKSILEGKNRLLYYHKGNGDQLGSMLSQVLRATAEGKEFTRGLHQKILFAAATDHPVLLLGETGTGKELVANSIHHNWSLRKATATNGARSSNERPFSTINCALLSGEMLRDELMGHVKGSFTGAFQHKLGVILRAAGLSPSALPKEDVERGPDFGPLNLAHDKLVKNHASFEKNPEQPYGEFLYGLNEFNNEMVKASALAKRFLERTIQSAATVGSEAFYKWLRTIGDKHIQPPTADSAPLDLVYNNEHSYGTLFLDEIGYLDPATQGMILRLLGSYEVSPLGYEGSIKLKHIRVIAATSNSSWLQFADSQRIAAAGHATFDDGPKRDLYYRLAHHVFVLDNLQEEEVEVFIERIGKARGFWQSTEGREITDEIKKAVKKHDFLGHRRELKTLIEMIEAYLKILPLLGRDDSRRLRDKISWDFIKANLWYPQQKSGVYTPEHNETPTVETEEDKQKKFAESMRDKIKDTVASHLGGVDWSESFDDRILRNRINSLRDATKNRQLRLALLEIVKLGRDKRSKQDKDKIARLVVPGVKDYQALKDLVKPKRPSNSTGST